MVLAYVTNVLVKQDEHVQNEVRALLLCQDHRVCELRKLPPPVYTFFGGFFSSPSLFAATGQQPTCS